MKTIKGNSWNRTVSRIGVSAECRRNHLLAYRAARQKHGRAEYPAKINAGKLLTD